MSTPVEIENTGIKLNTEVIDNDVHLQIPQLQTKINELEKEKKEIHDNYNAQRARLQKLYLQKEEELKGLTSEHVRLEEEVVRLKKELDDAKSQLCIVGIMKENEVEAEKRKAQAEIATLNQIVQDTVEVSSTSQSEVKKLKQVIQLLESQLNKLKGEREKEGLLLPSNMLSGAKTLARKVVGQLGNDSDPRSHDNLEDSMKKAQEDAEVLRSLVIPLEKKIQDLTDKLRTTEEKLRKYEPDESGDSTESNDKKKMEKSLIDLSYNTSQESGSHSPKLLPETRSPMKEQLEILDLENSANQAAVSPSKSISCDMCANYEAQLVSQQQLTKQLQKQKEQIENNMERFKEDLTKETQFRKYMEDKWNEKKEEHKIQVAELKKLYETAENELKTLQKVFSQVRSEVKEELSYLTFDREEINARLEELKKENSINRPFAGKFGGSSEQLKNELINFPNDIQALQELLLEAQEELIRAKEAKEAKEEEENILKCELELLRQQMDSELSQRNLMENNLAAENTNLRKQLDLKEKERIKLQNAVEKLSNSDKETKEQLKPLKAHLEEVLKEKKKLEKDVSELRSRVGSLQQELDTSETVQKDFVRLSQSLQIELEKIRGADKEVRWQHEDDIDDCPGCRNSFSSGRKKVHCRHCGRIFCQSCLSHVFLSGPRQRPANVCQVCHTLLNSETAPYFSQEPPHSPD